MTVCALKAWADMAMLQIAAYGEKKHTGRAGRHTLAYLKARPPLAGPKGRLP